MELPAGYTRNSAGDLVDPTGRRVTATEARRIYAKAAGQDVEKSQSWKRASKGQSWAKRTEAWYGGGWSGGASGTGGGGGASGTGGGGGGASGTGGGGGGGWEDRGGGWEERGWSSSSWRDDGAQLSRAAVVDRSAAAIIDRTAAPKSRARGATGTCEREKKVEDIVLDEIVFSLPWYTEFKRRLGDACVDRAKAEDEVLLEKDRLEDEIDFGNDETARSIFERIKGKIRHCLDAEEEFRDWWERRSRRHRVRSRSPSGAGGGIA